MADLLGEFSISETGGIDGEPGDQTGCESWVRDYYSGHWDGILHYNDKADGTAAPGESGSGAPSGDVSELAARVIAGDFGNGDERKRRLGDKYVAVQRRVNEMLGASGASSTSMDVDAMARAVIRGDYGNGEERRCRLESYYSIVQAHVNEMLS